MRVRGAASGAGRWWLPAWSALLTALVLGPLARPGFVLTYDMVTVPEQELTPDALGLGSALPRAVPQDAVLALLTSVVPGAVVYRVVLVAVVFGAALGAGMLLPRARPAVQAVAASAYVWNAYVAERLVIGHWTLLVAYAVLPWLLRQAMAVRGGEPGALPRALLLVATASLTPTGGILASAVLLLVVVAPRRPAGVPARRRLLAVMGCALFQVPWMLPAALTPTSLASDPAGVDVFAAHADSPLGLLGSVLTLGGIWNTDVVPASRGLWTAAVVTAVWVGLAIVGLRDLVAALGRAATVAVAVLTACGIVLAVAGSVDGVLAWAVEQLPGAGLLRDGHKFLAWYALALAPAVALGAARVAVAAARFSASAVSATLVVGAAAVLPLAALPDLAWGVAGRLEPVEYPDSWVEVRAVLRAQPAKGALAVLPYQPFRSFAWNDQRTVLDPLPRYAGVETVVPDDLTVNGTTLAGEDPRAAQVGRAIVAAEPIPSLLAAGIGWIAVEHGTPGVVPQSALAELDPVVLNGELDLYGVPGEPRPWKAVPPAAPVVAGHVAVLVAATALVGRGVTTWLARKYRAILIQSRRR